MIMISRAGKGKTEMKNTGLSLMVISIVIFSVTLLSGDSHGARKKRPPHHEYGNVVIDNFSTKNKIAPVVFNHWLHRAKYTCRLCHADLKFSLAANGTKITEKANKKGLYCGACHNGKEAFGPDGKGGCDRCHSYGKKETVKNEFYPFTRKFPRARFGNGINWIRAEKEGHLALKDELSGKPGDRARRTGPSDSVIKPDEPEMPLIIFSHDKHALWNGCDLCHPEPFKEKKGSPKFTMEEIIEGKFCGTCHGSVAFPVLDCQRCHTKPTILER